MQDLSRYAALTAWTIIKKHQRAYEAITDALNAGKGVRKPPWESELSSAYECLQYTCAEDEPARVL